MKRMSTVHRWALVTASGRLLGHHNRLSYKEACREATYWAGELGTTVRVATVEIREIGRRKDS